MFARQYEGNSNGTLHGQQQVHAPVGRQSPWHLQNNTHLEKSVRSTKMKATPMAHRRSNRNVSPKTALFERHDGLNLYGTSRIARHNLAAKELEKGGIVWQVFSGKNKSKNESKKKENIQPQPTYAVAYAGRCCKKSCGGRCCRVLLQKELRRVLLQGAAAGCCCRPRLRVAHFAVAGCC